MSPLLEEGSTFLSIFLTSVTEDDAFTLWHKKELPSAALVQ